MKTNRLNILSIRQPIVRTLTKLTRTIFKYNFSYSIVYFITIVESGVFHISVSPACPQHTRWLPSTNRNPIITNCELHHYAYCFSLGVLLTNFITNVLARTHSHHPILKPLLITIKIKKIGPRTVQGCLLESRRTKRAGVSPCNLNLL